MSENEAVSKPERAQRKFPYYPLPYAVGVATSLYSEGGGTMDRRQMAEILGISPNASSLEMRIITASMFGLVARREGRINITPLGRRVAAPVSPEELLADLSAAFDKVELFAAVRKQFAGSPLPAEAGLKVLLSRDFGVPENQRNEAYNCLVRSAKEAGILISRGSNVYLTTLPARAAPQAHPEQEMAETAPEVDSMETDVLFPVTQERGPVAKTTLHPSLMGLVNELASHGGNWKPEDRRIWEAALSAVLDYVYPNTRKKDGGGESRMGQEP